MVAVLVSTRDGSELGLCEHCYRSVHAALAWRRQLLREPGAATTVHVATTSCGRVGLRVGPAEVVLDPGGVLAAMQALHDAIGELAGKEPVYGTRSN